MPNPDTSLDIIIRTRAELAGAQQTAAALERDIAKAKSLGQSYNDLEVRLDKTNSAIRQYQGTHIGDTIGSHGKKVDILRQNYRKLSNAISQVSYAVPVLGFALRALASPLALITTAIVGSFALWKARTDELAASLSHVELPDIEPRDITQISQMAQAWKELGDAVKQAADDFNSSESVYQRNIADIERHTAALHKLLDAQKALDLSRAKTPQERAAVEAHYAAAGLSADEEAQRGKLARLTEEKFSLEVSAANKLAAAGRIQPGFSGATQEDAGMLKAAADAARKEIQQRQENLGKLEGSGLGSWWLPNIWYRVRRSMLTGKNASQLAEQERAMIQDAWTPINRYNAYLRSTQQNAERADLIKSAGEDLSKARTIGLQLPGVAAATRQDIATGRAVAGVQSQTRLNELGGTLAKESTDLGRQIAQLQNQAVNALRSNGAGVKDIIAQLQQLVAQQNELRQELSNVQGRLQQSYNR